MSILLSVGVCLLLLQPMPCSLQLFPKESLTLLIAVQEEHDTY